MQADILGTNRERGVPLGGMSFPGSGLHEAVDGYVHLVAAGSAGSGFPGLVGLMAETEDAGDLQEEPYATFIAEQLNSAFLVVALADPDRAEATTATLAHLDEVVRAFCRKHPKRYLYEEGQKRRVLVGMVSTPQDIIESPQLEGRDWFVDLEDPGRGVRLRYPGPQWQLHGTPTQLRRPAPLLGEHNNEVFAEIGVDGSALAALASEGVVTA